MARRSPGRERALHRPLGALLQRTEQDGQGCPTPGERSGATPRLLVGKTRRLPQPKWKIFDRFMEARRRTPVIWIETGGRSEIGCSAISRLVEFKALNQMRRGEIGRASCRERV